MRTRTASRVAALAFAIALASAGCTGVGGAEDCKPAQATIAFDNQPGGYLDVTDVHLINADGTNRRLLAQDGESPAWSPEGCRIAFVGGPGDLHIVNAHGGDLRLLTRSPASYPAWSPDGRRIAITLMGEENFTQTSHIDVLNSDGGGRRRLVPFQAGDPSWSPDGRRIAFARWFTISSFDLSPATLALLLERLAEESSSEEAGNLRRAASYLGGFTASTLRATAIGAAAHVARVGLGLA